jgi:hypothetical protein
LAKDVPIYRDGADAAILYWRTPRELAQVMRDIVTNHNISEHIQQVSRTIAGARAWPNVAALHSAFYKRVAGAQGH